MNTRRCRGRRGSRPRTGQESETTNRRTPSAARRRPCRRAGRVEGSASGTATPSAAQPRASWPDAASNPADCAPSNGAASGARARRGPWRRRAPARSRAGRGRPPAGVADPEPDHARGARGGGLTARSRAAVAGLAPRQSSSTNALALAASQARVVPARGCRAPPRSPRRCRAPRAAPRRRASSAAPTTRVAPRAQSVRARPLPSRRTARHSHRCRARAPR